MTIEQKIKLIEILCLNPSDIDYINDIKLSQECYEQLMSGNVDILAKELQNIVNNADEKDRVRLVAACLKNKLRLNELSVALDKACEDNFDNVSFGLIGPEVDDSYWKEREELAKENQKLWKEREKTAKASQKKLEKMSTDEICDEIFDYTLKKYPELANGYNSVLYRSGREDYYEMLCIRHCPNLVSHQEWTKLNIAASNVENKLRAYADKVIFDSINYWKNEYLAWKEVRKVSKITKSSIKSFFYEKGKKVSPNVIDKLLMELKK